MLAVDAGAAYIGLTDGSFGRIALDALVWARRWREGQRIGPEVQRPAEVLAAGDVVLVEPLAGDAGGGGGPAALWLAPGSRHRRRAGGAGSAYRAGARHGGRVQLRHQRVQPGDPGHAPARLGVQAHRLRRGRSTAASPRRASSTTRPSSSTRAPTCRNGSRPTTPPSSTAARRCASASRSRAT